MAKSFSQPYDHLKFSHEYFPSQFEEPYNTLLQGLQCFDFLGDGFIARIDFKRVLKEFKLPVQAIELEYFMAR